MVGSKFGLRPLRSRYGARVAFNARHRVNPGLLAVSDRAQPRRERCSVCATRREVATRRGRCRMLRDPVPSISRPTFRAAPPRAEGSVVLVSPRWVALTSSLLIRISRPLARPKGPPLLIRVAHGRGCAPRSARIGARPIPSPKIRRAWRARAVFRGGLAAPTPDSGTDL
jgi:hypothetical protein